MFEVHALRETFGEQAPAFVVCLSRAPSPFHRGDVQHLASPAVARPSCQTLGVTHSVSYKQAQPLRSPIAVNSILVSLFEYKAWANAELLAALAKFDAQQHPSAFRATLHI